MSKPEEIPDEPGEKLVDPFGNSPLMPPPPTPTGGYLGENDDEEVRKIRRRVTPFGKLVMGGVLLTLAGTGFFLVRTARHDAAVEEADQKGRERLREIVSQPATNEEIARQVREAYTRYRLGPELRMSARRVLARLKDNEAVPIMMEGLRGDGKERRQAAMAIAEIGMPAAAAAREELFHALGRTDPLLDRAEVVWAMVVVNDDRAWNSVIEMLGNSKLQAVTNLDDPPQRVFDPALVARLAGRERLVQMATHQSIGIRRIAVIALAEVANTEVYDTLVNLSRDADPDVARDAAVGIGRTGDPRAGGPIVAYLQAHPDSRDAVLSALAQSAGAQGLGVVITTSTEPSTRATAVRQLRELQDPGAGDAFMAAYQSVPANATDETLKRLRKDAIFGLAEIGDPRAFEGLMQLAMHPLEAGARVDPNTDQDARLALDLIRKIPEAPQRAKAQLATLLADPKSDFLRTPLMLALGASGDRGVARDMEAHIRNPDAQAGAAIAMARLRYQPGIEIIRQQMRRPANMRMNVPTADHEEVNIRRRNAIRALGWTRDPQYSPELIRIVEDPLDRDTLREEAGHSLAAIADDRLLDDIANRALDQSKPEEARLYYLYALRARATPAIANRLIQQYITPGMRPPLMRSTAIAAGFAGDATTAALIRPMLASSNTDVQLNAGIIAVLCGDEQLAIGMLDALRGDQEFVDLITNAFVSRVNLSGGPQGNQNTAPVEPQDLMPITASMFEDGRIFRRIGMVTMMDRGNGGNHHDFGLIWMRIRMKGGWENPLGIGPFEIRSKLREAARGTDAYKRDMAFRMLRALSDRGSLLFLRRQGGDSGERARQELNAMSTSR